MAEQKADFEQKKQEEMLSQYQREQEVLENRALLGDQKAKLGITFLYDAPPGADRAQEVRVYRFTLHKHRLMLFLFSNLQNTAKFCYIYATLVK